MDLAVVHLYDRIADRQSQTRLTALALTFVSFKQAALLFLADTGALISHRNIVLPAYLLLIDLDLSLIRALTNGVIQNIVKGLF